MKLVDLTDIAERKPRPGGLQSFWNAVIHGLARLGITLEQEGEASETIIRQFGRLLDNRYTMLKNVPLPGVATPIPLILVGPPGVYVINPRGESGIFRAREDSWVEMNRRTQKYEIGRQNLLEQTRTYATAVENYLREKGFSVTSVQPLLIFSNPGVHLESSRPIVRILLIDALERYIVTLAQSQSVIPIETNMALVESLSAPPLPSPAPEPVKKSQTPKSPPPLSQPMPLPPFLAKLNLTPKQWAILGVLAGLEILVLIVLILVVVLLS